MSILPGTTSIYKAIESWKDLNKKIQNTPNTVNSAVTRARDELGNYLKDAIPDMKNKFKDINDIYNKGSGYLKELEDKYLNAGGNNVSSTSSEDPRIRIRALGRDSQILYSGDILGILAETDGVIFPYTPTIGNLSWNANYQSIDVVHNNQEFYGYKNSSALQLTISGQFTAVNERETKYTFAALHFFRSCTKMRFGVNEPEETRGLPPPVLSLSGYGPMMFNDLPVILTSVTTDYNPNCDLVPVYSNSGGIIAWIPVLQTITISVTSQLTPEQTRQFNYADYVSGSLISRGGVL